MNAKTGFKSQGSRGGVGGGEKGKREKVRQAWSKLWAELFLTPVHLDSLLSRQHPDYKSILAQITPLILLRPLSLADALGVGVSAGEPWTLNLNQMGHWKAAQLLAEHLHQHLVNPQTFVGDAILADFPPLLLNAWQQSFGEQSVQAFVRILGQAAPLTLRVNRAFSRDEVLLRLKQEEHLSVQAQGTVLSPHGLQLAGYFPVLRTPDFQAGRFEIQDEGSQVMALFALNPAAWGQVLSPTPTPGRKLPSPPVASTWDCKQIIVDACAGAGGKTLALADLLQGKGRVYAYDVSEKKLRALRGRAVRAAVNNIQTLHVQEALGEEQFKPFFASADCVLVDAPCSGWGVLRRNPDLKWRQSPETLSRMPGLQLTLLSRYANLVAPGGRLIYGVCTFRHQETLDVVQQFSEQNPQFVPGPGGFLGPGPMDGFFMQAWTRHSS